jgi:hypothetical protein
VLGALVLLGDILSAVTAPAAVHAYEAAAAEGRDPTQIPTAHDAAGLLYVRSRRCGLLAHSGSPAPGRTQC